MNKYDHINENDFLKGYAEFTIKIRPYIICELCEKYKTTSNQDEKEYLYILAIEQFFLLYETFEGFFRAIKDRHEKSIFASLEQGINIQNLYESLKNKTDQNILDEFNISLNQFNEENRKNIEERVARLATLWKNDNFYEAMKILIPVFNKLKHKLLFYKKDGRVYPVLESFQEENFEKILKKPNIEKESILLEDIDRLVDMSKLFKGAILDLIEIRLIELRHLINNGK